jgi:hypothetical protein
MEEWDDIAHDPAAAFALREALASLRTHAAIAERMRQRGFSIPAQDLARAIAAWSDLDT